MMTEQAISSPSTVLRPAAGVRLFLTEDEGILFDEMGQKLFHLNSVAACIWCYIEEACPIEVLSQSIASSMNIDETRAHQFVLGMVRTWWSLGLVQGSRRQPSTSRHALSVGEHSFSVASMGVAEPRPSLLQYHYRLLDVRFSLSYPRSLKEILHPVLAHLEMQDPALNPVCLTITRLGQEWRVLQGMGVLGACRDLQRLVPLVHGILASLALRNHSYLLAVHAGGVAWDDRAMLLVGKSQSGKTVLTGAMIGEGWDYLSDDMILIGRDGFYAQAVPSSLTVKPGGWELLASRFPGRDAPRQHLRADGKTVAYLPPPTPQRGFNVPRLVRWVVFPSRDPGSPSGVRALRPLEGLQRLLNHCCGIPSALLPEDIRRMIEASADIRWFEMTLDDLDAAVATLHSIARIDPCDLQRCWTA
jgi:hypothetical protein